MPMPIATPNDCLFTTTEAAEYLNLSRHTVSVYIGRGLLKTEKHGPLNFIKKSECDRYSREKRPRGNPMFHKGKRRRKSA